MISQKKNCSEVFDSISSFFHLYDLEVGKNYVEELKLFVEVDSIDLSIRVSQSMKMRQFLQRQNKLKILENNKI